MNDLKWWNTARLLNDYGLYNHKLITKQNLWVHTKFLTNALSKKTELELTADFYNGHFTADRDTSLGLEKNEHCWKCNIKI